MNSPTKRILLSSMLLPLLGGGVAVGQTIEDTLGTAYIQSTQLESQRAQQRASDEQVPQVLSNWRPTVALNGNVTRSHTAYGPPGFAKIANSSGLGLPSSNPNPYNTTKTVGVQVTQPLYRGGKTVAQTSQATNAIKAGQQQLAGTEQSVLLAAAQSYLDVVRDQSTVELNANNESVLKRQFDAETDRFRVGEVTRTDVALSQSSYEQARAQHTTAIGTLATDRAAFQRVVGQAPGTLIQPAFKYRLPDSLEDAIAEAEANNPLVLAAELTERASRDAVDAAEADRLPTVSLIGTYSRLYPGLNGTYATLDTEAAEQGLGKLNHLDTGSVAVQMSWPIYTGGLASSLVRQAKHTANQYLIAVEDAKRVARQTAISAWQQLIASRANIEALTAQVNAAQIGAEGTRQQALVGTSTVLDSLTAEQNLLQAQVNLATAQHDALLNSFQLLDAVGRMTARDLDLNVPIYDPQVNLDKVSDKWFGVGIQ